MKRLIGILALIGALAAIAVAPAVGGGGSGKGHDTISATCTVLGSVTVHANNGASAWIGNTHYVLLKLQGTFTPVSGPAQSFTKVYGKKSAFRTTYTCTGSESDATGTFSFTATVARTPTH